MKNKVIELLNKNLANVQTLYVKLHNYHWNVKGMMFKPVHEMTEAYYDYFAKQYDDVAERIIQVGGKPFAAMKDYLGNTSIKEESKNDFGGKTVVAAIIPDFELLVNEYKEISKSAGELEDATTVALADNNIAWLEKEIWMLKATLG